ncbi:hypothetical protein CkaCkLH20_02787 [Colletotrichum karsti]|uniref:Uncharacterized protein n=1 Tax=Colletotrichum karsti TaxID=1095194 RepID=A0A9P6LP48_9PEZI|nr:uncharacterized protein CkaCkLH20_02787 [Colletotrichum karsti]KAF9879976.1 hypothetical protein CkaCkLH20_02787 [Colletotrichum karsti]
MNVSSSSAPSQVYIHPELSMSAEAADCSAVNLPSGVVLRRWMVYPDAIVVPLALEPVTVSDVYRENK